MINQFINLLSLPGIILFMLKAFWVQQRFIKKQLDPLIDDIQKAQDAGLTSGEIKKIRRYYGFAVPAILGEGFGILRDKSLTKKERLALTYLGASTGLYDDFFDDLNTSENHIRELTTNPTEKIAQNSSELLFVRCYKNAIDNAPDPNLLKQRAFEVFEAQVLSKKQKGSTISQKEIRSITYLKGGVSLLFYRSVLDREAQKAEQDMLYALGQLMQLENDVFDVYKDLQHNISTLVTIERSIANLRKTYHELMNETFILLGQTDFRPKNKRFFMRFICLIIYRELVCLDCLERNEKLSNNRFSVRDYSRKQLICDMEKFKQLVKLIKHFSNCETSILSTASRVKKQ
ncbi:MAG: class 1 isoprenoid biosynthesis enzyme [Bacteroidetes bacterium]|nr:class 1 isoprenoid biosynthesis enzyme [Bacteroidota bacterium]MBU1577924.1 class 1 isoprenoid biosynthesis enzyme [Bacteroidota bacterium]MBU2558587.1 class 1 isoprenoid biosynthesis enzyme [Bacteroidota bacterium]